MSFQEVLAVIVNRRSSSDTGHAFNRPRADTVRFDGINAFNGRFGFGMRRQNTLIDRRESESASELFAVKNPTADHVGTP